MLAESKTEIPVKLKLIHKQKLPTGVLASSLVSDGASLIAGCMNGVFRADFADSKHEQLYEHSSYVSSVHWLAEQKLILSAGYDGNVSWYDTESNRIARRESMHDFWSWDMAVSPDGSVAASVTGQYLAGGYKYEPLPEREPSLKLFAIKSGEVLHELPHVPSVQAVAFSPDGQLVAAANIMGEVRVWNVKSGERVCEFTTPDFTSWGIIKSHCYLGGIFSLIFTPDSSNLLLAGMGPMRDPMAGNGKQLWQRWSIEESPSKTAEIRRKDAGEGLMETLAVRPGGTQFVMGGRLRGGDWNAAIFDLETGSRLATLKTGFRVTEACFSQDGSQLVLVGAQGQPRKLQDGQFNDFGRVEVYSVDDA